MGGHKKSVHPKAHFRTLPDSPFISQVHCGLKVPLAQASSVSWSAQTNQED